MKKKEAPTWVARGALGCGALAFIGMGLPFVWLMLGAPTLALVRSQAWPQASCEVLYTGVQPGVTHSRGGSAYRPLVAYAYTVSGREYISAAFEVQPRDYKNEDDAKAQAAAFAAGSRWKCYVDPADTSHAVLLRRFNVATLLGLLPGLFPVFGLLMLYAAFSVGRSGPAQPAQAAGWLPAAATPEGGIVGSQSVRLAPTSSPLGAFIGLLFANLIWNGLTFGFMYLGWHDGGLRKFEPGMLCFLPFPLIGLMLLFSIPFKFLALFNPRPYLTLSRQALRPGESLTLRYELTPFGFRVRRLQLWLKGSEHKVSGDKAGNTHEFYSAAVLDQNRGEEASTGQLTLTIPEGVMHSFEGRACQIRWRLKLVADIPLFPDVEQEFTLTVLPGGRA